MLLCVYIYICTLQTSYKQGSEKSPSNEATENPNLPDGVPCQEKQRVQQILVECLDTDIPRLDRRVNGAPVERAGINEESRSECGEWLRMLRSPQF